MCWPRSWVCWTGSTPAGPCRRPWPRRGGGCGRCCRGGGGCWWSVRCGPVLPGWGFRVTGARGRVVYTSRDPAVIDAVAARPYRVDVLSSAAARALAAGVLEQPVAGLPAAADRAFERVGRVALAVALLAAAIRGGAR